MGRIIDPARPYEPLGVSTADWLSIPPTLVSLSGLCFSQEHLSIEGLLKAARGGDNYVGDIFIYVVRYNGDSWIVDGHHRAVVAIIRGKKEILARVMVKE